MESNMSRKFGKGRAIPYDHQRSAWRTSGRQSCLSLTWVASQLRECFFTGTCNILPLDVKARQEAMTPRRLSSFISTKASSCLPRLTLMQNKGRYLMGRIIQSDARLKENLSVKTDKKALHVSRPMLLISSPTTGQFWPGRTPKYYIMGVCCPVWKKDSARYPLQLKQAISPNKLI